METTQEGLKEVLASLKTVQGTPEAKKQVWEALEATIAAVRRVEAAKAVQGFFGSSAISVIDNILQVATPIVALYGDFELSNLLGSLKVWLDRKKLEEREDQMRRDRVMNQGVDDLTFTYQM